LFFKIKKNSNLCLYINYKNLNKISIKNYYFLFIILEIFDSVSDSKYFLKINIKNIYYQICIKENNK
ncbi:hypothetical protein BO85DRAFT_361585, partial [Aspergillus piperis CBS 112811]